MDDKNYISIEKLTDASDVAELRKAISKKNDDLVRQLNLIILEDQSHQDRVRLKAEIRAIAEQLDEVDQFKRSTTEKPKPFKRAEKQGRNSLCSCGSGKKFKRCCLGK